jgi:hypothetical protein
MSRREFPHPLHERPGYASSGTHNQTEYPEIIVLVEVRRFNVMRN